MKSKVVKAKKTEKEVKPLTSVEERIEKLVETSPPKENTVHETKPPTSVHTENELEEKETQKEEKSFLDEPENTQDDNNQVVAVEKSSVLMQVIIPLIVGIVVGIASGVAAVYLLSKNNSNPKTTVKPTPTQTAKVQATPTPSGLTEADLTFYDVTVLNGSGKSGEAAKVEKLLKDKGFSVLETGNADKSSYTKTQIKAKSEVSEKYISELNKILSELYIVDKTASLSADEKTDVVVIVGKETVETTTTPTP